MARKRTAEDLIADVRSRAGMERSKFVKDPEILEYLNQARAELDSRIQRAEGQVHSVRSTTIAVAAGTVSYPLPEDFKDLLGITVLLQGITQQLDPFMENERAMLTNATITYPYAGFPKYRIMGEEIEFLPSTHTFVATVRYRPGSVRLRLGRTPPDAVSYPNGQEMAMVYDAVATCLEKEETDSSHWTTQRDRIYQLIMADAAQRDASHPERATDVTGGIGFDPWGT